MRFSSKMRDEFLANNVKAIKALTLKMVHNANASHIGGSLSMVEIITVLYFEKMNIDPSNPKWPKRDRFLLSKGHCCSSLYACLSLKGYFSKDELMDYGKDGTRLLAHASHYVPGVELSTGSLGHALPVAVGMSLAAKRKAENWQTYVVVSDGELDEGSNWEAILFAGHHGLDNLTVIVDNNKIQSLGTKSEVLDLEPIDAKFQAFRWDVQRFDGHDIRKVRHALSHHKDKSKPRLLIADSIKGKGVDFMENNLAWHYKSPDRRQLKLALRQLGEIVDNA